MDCSMQRVELDGALLDECRWVGLILELNLEQQQ